MRPSCVAALAALLFVVAGAPARAQLSFAKVVEARRPHPDELELESLLAEAQRLSAGGRSFLAEGLTSSVEAGPRDTPGGVEADAAVEVEAPLLAARSHRGALSDLLPQAAGAMREATALLAEAELADVFVAAWLAQEVVAVRQQDLAAVTAWLSAAQSRVAEGADAPYEPILVAGERDRALVELLDAQREVAASWGELVARAEISVRPLPLDIADLPGRIGDATLELSPVPQAGIEARRRLSLALAAVEAASAESRWGLKATVAREADENVAHAGVAYRLPLRGERAGIAAGRQADESRAHREAELALAGLEARLAIAAAALAAIEPTLTAAELEGAETALQARIAEGKERTSEVLPLRRQLLEARIAALEARAARLSAAAQLHILGGGDQP
jgi:outer membrane protein TolC